MTDLNELLERVRGATGPDRELDLAIKIVVAAHMISGGASRDVVHATLGADLFEAPTWTASIDAALALVERVLRPEHPSMTMELRFVWAGRDDRGWYRAEITWPSHEFIGHASSAPLATIEALLQALNSGATNVQ